MSNSGTGLARFGRILSVDYPPVMHVVGERAEPSTIHRAFRRWTDSSPREYRASTEKS